MGRRGRVHAATASRDHAPATGGKRQNEQSCNGHEAGKGKGEHHVFHWVFLRVRCAWKAPGIMGIAKVERVIDGQDVHKAYASAARRRVCFTACWPTDRVRFYFVASSHERKECGRWPVARAAST